LHSAVPASDFSVNAICKTPLPELGDAGPDGRGYLVRLVQSREKCLFIHAELLAHEPFEHDELVGLPPGARLNWTLPRGTYPRPVIVDKVEQQRGSTRTLFFHSPWLPPYPRWPHLVKMKTCKTDPDGKSPADGREWCLWKLTLNLNPNRKNPCFMSRDLYEDSTVPTRRSTHMDWPVARHGGNLNTTLQAGLVNKKQLHGMQCGDRVLIVEHHPTATEGARTVTAVCVGRGCADGKTCVDFQIEGQERRISVNDSDELIPAMWSLPPRLD
jgi:hypothetical protein